MKSKLLLCILLFTISITQAQITLNETLTPEELVEDILIANPAFTISNIAIVSGSDFGFENSIAAFEVDTSVFPFSGLALATGDIGAIQGPNVSFQSDGGWTGDEDLEDIVGAFNTNDATSVSFDFVTDLTLLEFGVIFASEEYDQNFECTFADAFAIILTNTVTNESINIATVPGTSAPITTLNVKPEVAGQCEATNPEFFGFYNFMPFNDSEAAINNFNGQTTIIPISSPIESGILYRIKIVIADDTDTAFNSGIFIKQGNFAMDNDVDNISNLVEDRNQNGDFDDDDTDNDAIPNYLDSDDDGDSLSTQIEVFEIINGVEQRNIIDTDNDGIENYLDEDDDGDGTLTIDEDYNNNGDLLDDDLNGNGVPDYLDPDVTLTTDTFEINALSVYPNPAINEIVISGDRAFTKASVFNLKGELVLNFEGDNQKSHTIDISKMPHGIFFIKIETYDKALKFLKK